MSLLSHSYILYSKAKKTRILKFLFVCKEQNNKKEKLLHNVYTYEKKINLYCEILLVKRVTLQKLNHTEITETFIAQSYCELV